MKRIQETFKVTYTYTTGHDPEPQNGYLYVWALDEEDAKMTFCKLTTRSNYANLNSTPCDPPDGENIYEP